MSSMACLNIEIPKKPANKTASEHRRATKPIMEKRRRARINHSLNELKSLILDALNRDPTRNSKLEKADILEMTVKHLQNLQRQQMALEATRDPGVLSKYKAGFSECASEVSRYVNKIDGVDGSLKQRIVSHLNNCLQSLPASPAPPGVFSGQGTIAFPGMSFSSGASPSPLQVHIPVGHHHLFSTSSSSASSTPSSAVNLTTTASDINNNLHRRSENSSETSKLTPPASATSAFSFSFPSVTSSLSPVTPSTPSTPGFTTAADFRFAPYKISVHPWSHHHHHRRDVLRSVSPGSSSSMGSLSPAGSDSVDCESIASSSDKNCSGSDVWRPW